MKYKVGAQVQDLTSSKGNQYKKFNLKDEAGNITEGVVAFTSYKMFAGIESGADIEGILQEKEYNGNKSYTLADGNLGARTFGGGAKMVAEKAKNIEKAMDRKEEGISKFQDNKEHSIMVASSASQATEILTALMQKESFKDWKEEWLKIRYYIVSNWLNVQQPKVGSTGVDYPQDDINPEDIPF